MTPERIHTRLQAIADDITVAQQYAMEEHESVDQQERSLEALIGRVDGIADAATGRHVDLKERRRQMRAGLVTTQAKRGQVVPSIGNRRPMLKS